MRTDSRLEAGSQIIADGRCAVVAWIAHSAVTATISMEHVFDCQCHVVLKKANHSQVFLSLRRPEDSSEVVPPPHSVSTSRATLRNLDRGYAAERETYAP